MIDKIDTLKEILARLEEGKREAEQSRKAAHGAMVDAPGPMQSHSDTTRFQKSILIDQYNALIAEKSQAISIVTFLLDTIADKAMDRIQTGAAIEVAGSDGVSEFYMMIPYAAGISLVRGGKTVTTVTPASPLGAALLKKRVGDEIEVQTTSGTRKLKVLSLA